MAFAASWWLHLALAHQVYAAVADVPDDPSLARDEQAVDRRAHALEARIRLAHLEHL